ncbi:MAG: hypothetical protein ACI9AR_000578 [Flavobacteriaceae bacterium]|jgi:hypothetical protein
MRKLIKKPRKRESKLVCLYRNVVFKSLYAVAVTTAGSSPNE